MHLSVSMCVMLSWLITAAPWLQRALPVILLLALLVATFMITSRYYDSRHAAEIAQLHADADRQARAAVEKARRLEQIKNDTLEEERANHLAALEIMGIALAGSRDESERLRGTIATERRRAATLAAAAGRDRAAAEAPWVVLDECRREYAQMARDADWLNERARLGAGYARAVMAE